jgi:hypothetical protein
LGLLIASCSNTSSSPPPVGVSVSWLTDRGTIPDNVTGLQFVVIGAMQTETCINRDGGPLPEDPTCSAVGSPPTAEGTETPNSIVRDLDRDGRAEILADSLPINTPFSIELRAFGDPTLLHVGYIGRVGPIVLKPGERRHIALRMYATGASTELVTGDMDGRFLQTATTLRDGRVLIAGGFTVATREDCAPALGTESRCFGLVASQDAWLFEPATARFHPVAGGMLAARGGHTATRLPDGRVLIAGGAANATLELKAVGSGTARGFEPRFIAADADASPTSFEIFDPGLNPEADDTDGDGDPARGGFVGGPGAPSSPGRLDAGRVMHAAAASPTNAGRVILAGGFDAEGRSSWEIFDIAKPGGYGVYFNAGNVLPTPRTLPSAMTTAAAVWIVGGADGTNICPATDDSCFNNRNLADVWVPGSDPNGAVSAATDYTGGRFPAGNVRTEAPQYNLYRPVLAPLDDGRSMLTVGWFGPRCVPGSPEPAFGPSATDFCAPNTGAVRNYTVTLAPPEARRTVPSPNVGAMSFGSSATLDDGSVLIVGGISETGWGPVRVAAVHFEATTDATGSAVRSAERPMPVAGRVLGASAPIAGGGVLTVGGFSARTDLDSLDLVQSAEVWIRRR